MAEWKRSTFDLPDDHGWTARPGNSIFVANRGAVLFEYPSDWVLKPDGNSICLYDREAPDDNMRLQVSVIRLGPGPIERRLEHHAAARQPDGGRRAGPTTRGSAPPERAAGRCLPRQSGVTCGWRWTSWTRTRSARRIPGPASPARGNVQAFITMEYWPEDRRVCRPRSWSNMLESLKLADYLYDDNPH